jgi:LysR family transcriptional activator of nhaA
MERLNYHHLLYFYTVAQEGSVARASSRLGLKQPTVSAQIHALEEELGQKLLQRSGRGLKLTVAGETVLRYAKSIFALGGELRSALEGHAEDAPKLNVGVSSSLPSVLVAALLKGIFRLNPRPVLTVVEGTAAALAASCAAQSLQFVLADAQEMGTAGTLPTRVLLESSVGGFAPDTLARRLGKDFPDQLAKAPVLMPSAGAVRHAVDIWFASHKQVVKVVAELPHPELHAATAGAVVFAPMLLRESLKKAHGLVPVGELKGSRWRAVALTSGRGVRHPGLEAVIRAAEEWG